ncbi:universal stress protein [Psychroserpens luteolus]|uniref:universal stress protein n=1 Tax=Psychroserpens luteolus TaxID=2855840 RepID=UPI001E6067CE|nr:universal stress protein [Psychroserpens luteolus]MCD2258495.1 universal stress protein [Psychroserpens luteolus]
MKTNNNKYKILVLSDMKDTTSRTLKSSVSLSKMIDGNIHFFHVRKPTEIIEKESQLSAMRTINKAYVSISSEIKNIIEPIAKDYNTDITYNHTFGNVKNEILNCIETHKPDIIVLGKRKSKSINLLGDNITDFIIKNHNGAIMIASEQGLLEPETELSIGLLDDSNTTYNLEFVDALFNHTQKPLKSFRTAKKESHSGEEKTFANKDTVELVFDYGDNSIKSLSNYLAKSDVNLLYLNRANNNNTNQRSKIKDLISNVNVSLFISEEQKQ